MKLYSRLLMVFLWKFLQNNDEFGYLNPFWGSYWRCTSLVDGLLESPWLTFYSHYLNFIATYYGSSYEAKCVQLGCFHRGLPLCTQILPGQGHLPSTILGMRKLETLGYPTVKTVSLCIRTFLHNIAV